MLTADRHTTTMDHAGPGFELVLSRIGSLLLGVEGRWVERVQAPVAAGATGPDDLWWDVAQGFGLREPCAATARRNLMIRAPNATVRVLVGPAVWMRVVEATRLRSLPAFLDGLWRRLPLLGLFEHDGGVGYLLDVERLEGCAREVLVRARPRSEGLIRSNREGRAGS